MVVTLSKDIEVKSGTIVTRGGNPLPAHIASPQPLPAVLEGKFTIADWFKSLAQNVEYNEPDPDFLAKRMLYITLSSPTPEDVLTPSDLTGLQDLIPNAPQQTTGPILITDLYICKSDQADGNKCYMLLTYVTEATGMETTTTTGATHLQGQVMTMLAHGVWPIRCEIKRGDRQDRGGRYMLSMVRVED